MPVLRLSFADRIREEVNLKGASWSSGSSCANESFCLESGNGTPARRTLDQVQAGSTVPTHSTADRPTRSEFDLLDEKASLLVKGNKTVFDLVMKGFQFWRICLAREAEKGYPGDHSRPPGPLA